MSRSIKIAALLLAVSASVTSCKVELKPYERVYINDQEMQMITRSEIGFQQYVQSIREGAIIPLSKKGKGGCGCN